ncbi:FtsQ-type POTRA domain-containing protein [Candidatus Nomurabacteria bacterium]|nr:FtsQ-type POTRA domain-containing protein [Candidatus Nomurabacteria bacterium]
MYKDKRGITTSPKIVEMAYKRKKRNIRLSILLFILFVVIIVGLSYLSNYKKITISNIVISGTHIIDSKNVEERIKEDLAGKYIYLFAKKNVFIYPKSYIEKDLRKTFPRIQDLSIKLEGLNTLRVEIGERTGSYMYCGSNIPEKIEDLGENCYFINSDGYIFDIAPYFSGNIYFKFYLPLDDTKDILGQNVMDKENFNKIIAFTDELTELGFKPVSLIMNDEDRYSLHLEARPDGGEPEILYKKDNDIDTIFSNLSSAMKKTEFKNEIMTKLDKLDYIDLRFNNKVLYKFK